MGTRLGSRLSVSDPSSSGQIASPAFPRYSIPPAVADENPEGKAKNQDGIDHQVEHGMPPLADAVARSTLQVAEDNVSANPDTRIVVSRV
jgi:hypothetical protein